MPSRTGMQHQFTIKSRSALPRQTSAGTITLIAAHTLTVWMAAPERRNTCRNCCSCASDTISRTSDMRILPAVAVNMPSGHRSGAAASGAASTAFASTRRSSVSVKPVKRSESRAVGVQDQYGRLHHAQLISNQQSRSIKAAALPT
jgi:hypothetical protein